MLSPSALVLACKACRISAQQLRKATRTETQRTASLQSERAKELARRIGAKEVKNSFSTTPSTCFEEAVRMSVSIVRGSLPTPRGLQPNAPALGPRNVEPSKLPLLRCQDGPAMKRKRYIQKMCFLFFGRNLISINVSVPWRALRKSV